MSSQPSLHTEITQKPSTLKKLIILAVIIGVTLSLVALIYSNPPQSKRAKPSKAPQMTVATKILAPQRYQVMVESFGTVKPRTQSILFAQVAGQITQVSGQFRDGGFFEKGDVLVQLDDRDYRSEVKVSQANLLSANQVLLEEQARVQQAEADWQRLGNGKVAGVLVLRQPQLESAKAKVLSAQAQLDKAKLSLERTQIVAPYAGRILKKQVDIGQVVTSNSQLATIFAVDYVEIRLPINNKDLSLINLPEVYRDIGEQGNKDDVKISSDLIGHQSWNGKIIRTESAIDEQSQQLYVVAQINRPYDATTSLGSPIKIGQYVTAQITGKELSNVLVIPSNVIYQGSYVYTVENGLLIRKEVLLGWQNGKESIVESGLVAGDELVLTSLGQVSSGTPVAIEGNIPSKARQNNPEARQNKAKLKGTKRSKGEAQ
ncbi:efflux RND transporter periplasmic adaptor subunit [Colwellia sp. BRX8-4]|uniref:efflux RND transporter periplasmic adaptor subunit n=1 Tax=Colwellia sp. BRX8-4 TaxID=2759836 RepID=UPI0015F3B27A|nr:efflux RND transporter periplasmic adaptor subunit [Colwellia sp. BRX8-4]MBA6363360.1 efflux RND transporter periplasmic adaptor subunit [Colwellia sp. BRX8-8]MBA6370360.1 efflux RND transporter periplasmic adaptor subunit [Colwellia sp. BRX8-4]